MEYKDISDLRSNRQSVNGSNEWFMVQATSREVSQLAFFFKRAVAYPHMVREHPGLRALTASLLEVVARDQAEPETITPPYQLIVDRSDFECIEIASQVRSTYLRLTPAEQYQVTAARYGQPGDGELIYEVDASPYL